MITYKETKQIEDKDLRPLYLSVGWASYTERITDLSTLLVDCQLVYSAWDTNTLGGEKLVGLIRTVGDGLSIQYIQDFLVLPDYQKQGIGTTLFKKVLEHSEHIRQLVLITDGSEENREIIEYYKNLGLRTFTDAGLCGLWRMK